MPLVLRAFLCALPFLSAVHASDRYFAKNSIKHLEQTYWPEFKKLFIVEGNPAYPMPPAHKVIDLLPGLKGIAGIAVHTSPGTTVTEGQGYAMFSAGMQKDVETLKGLTVAWQANGQGFANTPPCGGCGVNSDDHFAPEQVCTGKTRTPCLCKTVPGAYMPGWDMPYTQLGSMGSATDGDEDAVMGLIYLAELTDSDEFRAYAVKSIAAFVLEDLGYAKPELNSRRVPVTGDIPESLQTMFLWRGGSCWGGYDTSSLGQPEDRNLCIAPAYFSPGQWRVFKEYLAAHSEMVPSPYTAEDLGRVLESAIVWGYNTLARISCDNGLVSNWWTVPNQGWPYEGGLKCANSGTSAGAYYSDAARIPWRIALDYIWFPDAKNPLYDRHGRLLGTWGAKEYSNRWANGWKQLITSQFPPGTFPPFSSSATPLRKDQVIPLLSQLTPCSACPTGFMASPWNGWGSYPVATTFMVPIDGVMPAEQQQWVDFLAEATFSGCTSAQYFDLGQEIIVSALLAGAGWLPEGMWGAQRHWELEVNKPAVHIGGAAATKRVQSGPVTAVEANSHLETAKNSLLLPNQPTSGRSSVSPNHETGSQSQMPTPVVGNPSGFVSGMPAASSCLKQYEKCGDDKSKADGCCEPGCRCEGNSNYRQCRPQGNNWQCQGGNLQKFSMRSSSKDVKSKLAGQQQWYGVTAAAFFLVCAGVVVVAAFYTVNRVVEQRHQLERQSFHRCAVDFITAE